MEFQYHLPVNLVFGRGKSELIGEKAAALGKKALIVTGGRSTRESGLLEKAEQLLKKSGLAFSLFDKVTPNPLTTTAYEGAEQALSKECDMVLALGGGSSLDAAKGIAFQAVNGGDINEYIYGRKISNKALPVLAVPTTCGTGSEGNGFAVMTNPDTLDKKSLRCSAIVPACSIIDPLLMKTMPKKTLASVGFDALCHNMDAYISAVSQPLTDIMALEGARLAAGSLTKLYRDNEDMDSWEHLCLASTLGGMVIGAAGVTALHGMEHPVSGLKNVVHGKGLAALAPYVYEASIQGAPDKFLLLSRILGGRDEKDFVPAIKKLLSELQLTETLGDMGVEEKDLNWLTENCLKVSAPSMANHPVVFTTEKIREIFRKAL
ncbi:iron-containing alcohol dehydrogenase [Anaerocolumna sp. AGMB13020]|uniref:iron-containing alcohol dehydrogenase n=1 Tax=Anaerocolumna sp. AGMB13020 TaxID=3081750 RepID=UPI002954B199|nr:iron-containing alcohol dehydrogenase [Anaerocolumna sp. AGMB13020]WOO39054.1 iron-containing alcohol dehydrogenase [Anaerocolumna sp. AGMB13020]